MKPYVMLSLVATVLFSCQHPNKTQTTLNPNNPITIGQIDSLYSNILNEQRKIWVHVPGEYNPSDTSQAKYPVLFLLDGDAHFHSVTGIIKQLSSINGNIICPEMIVVGIPNTDRTRDLTPTHIEVAFGDSTAFKTSGGGDQFTQFIEKELIPYIDQNYPTTAYRTYVGHSFGGLTVVNTLIHHPHLFDNYIAIDPSMWWDNQALSKTADSILSQHQYNRKAFYVAVANTMQKGMSLNEIHSDTSESTIHIRALHQFVKSTEKKKDNGLLFKWKYYGTDDHCSVTLIAEYDAIHFLFPWYKLDDIDQHFNPHLSTTAKEFAHTITSHYKQVSDHFGYKVYPKGALANESMDDYYASQKDTFKAITYFSKAVKVGNNPMTKEKLEKLSINKIEKNSLKL